MKRVPRPFGPAMVAVLSALAAFGVLAAPAFATPVPATWSATGSAKWTTTSITVKKNGGSAVTCTPGGTLGGYTSNEGGLATSWVYNNSFVAYSFNCPGGKHFGMIIRGEGLKDGAARSFLIEPAYTEYLTLPFSFSEPNYYMDMEDAEGNSTLVVPFTNGSGATSSTVTFNNTVIGHSPAPWNATISVTGTFKATTGTGGLLTLK